MVDWTRRQCLKAAGVSVTALGFGIGGTVATSNKSQNKSSSSTSASNSSTNSDNNVEANGQSLDYEKDENGNIEFDWKDVTFETDGDELEFSVGDPSVSLEVDGNEFELSLENVAGASLQFETQGNETEFTASSNGEEFEDEGDEITWSTDKLDFEWSSGELDIGGAITLEYDGTTFEYQDSAVSIEYDAESNEFEAAKNS